MYGYSSGVSGKVEIIDFIAVGGVELKNIKDVRISPDTDALVL
jgi:hypothetical protein